MRISSSQRRRQNLGPPTLPPPPGLPDENPPSLPLNTTKGVPAHTQIDWGNKLWFFINQSSNATWHARGHQGYKAAAGYLPSFGGGDRFVPSSAESLSPPSLYQGQQELESTGNNYAAGAHAAAQEIYVGWYFRKAGQSTSAPPFLDWFNATTKSTVLDESTTFVRAFSSEWLNLDGMTLDLETPTWEWNYAGNTHTEAETRAQVRLWGYDLGKSWWTHFPAMRLIIYSFGSPGDWQNKVQNIVNGIAYPRTTKVYQDFLQGLFEGMRDSGSTTGQIILAASAFYRSAANLSGQPSARQDSAYKINSQAPRAWYSTHWDQDVWDYAASRLRCVGFTWRTTDGTSFYDATEPNDATWSSWLLDSRSYSEGSRRVEYNYSGWVGSIPEYSSAAAIAGSTAASSNDAITTSGPTFTLSPSATASGGTVSITCGVRDKYGIACVRVYDGTSFDPSDPEASFLGCMKMAWNEGGGAYNAQYTDDQQSCTFSATGVAGDWFVLGAFGIRADSFEGLNGETTWTMVKAT